ncbi:hypothetical protein V8C26DRAFT_414813 [Trichoderma gracile]
MFAIIRRVAPLWAPFVHSAPCYRNQYLQPGRSWCAGSETYQGIIGKLGFAKPSLFVAKLRSQIANHDGKAHFGDRRPQLSFQLSFCPMANSFSLV